MKDEINVDIDRVINSAVASTKTNLTIDYIKNIMETLGYTAEQAMDLLKIPKENRIVYMPKLLNSMGVYRVNPFCTECGEEHAYYDIQLTEEEQAKIDEFYRVNADKPFWELMFMKAPLIVERKFKCPACGKIFVGKASVFRDSVDDSQVRVGICEI
jgi:DNA-directed RNA polymerase subunit M/transcription elongation factor TFIIS